MKKVTMQDIANALGISKSLVSFALNDKYGVSPDMRFKVFNTAIELGYDFNYNYRNKNESSRKNIIVFSKNRDHSMNYYWSELLKSSEKLLSEENSKFMIKIWNDSTKEEDFFNEIYSGTVLGILIIDYLPDNILNSLKKTNIPIIFVDGKFYEDKEYDNVRTNNYLGGYLAAEYLKKMGHKKIAFVGNKTHSISFRERYYGFKNYIDENPDLEYYGLIEQSTYDISKDFVSESNVIKCLKDKNRPTALFCANDIIGIFVYEEMKKIGLKPYEDVSIIAFDNLKETYSLNPPLTSVSVKINELGKIAVEQLLYRIKFKDSPKKSTFLSVEISEKESVKRME